MHVSLDEMTDFARIHFAHEEALLRLHGFRYVGLALPSIADAIRELDRTGKPSFYAEAGDTMVKPPRSGLSIALAKVTAACALHAKGRRGSIVVLATIQ